LLGTTDDDSEGAQDASKASSAPAGWTCPKCGGLMVVVERLTAAQIRLRSPPTPSINTQCQRDPHLETSGLLSAIRHGAPLPPIHTASHRQVPPQFAPTSQQNRTLKPRFANLHPSCTRPPCIHDAQTR
jgi:hypothetical protein